ncbi:hypothetical protein ACN3XK_07895 [Actinomadura welshii]
MPSLEELYERLNAAYKLDSEDNGGVTTETYWRTMRDLLGEAEALGDPVLVFRVQIAYGWALKDSKTPRNDPREVLGEWLDLLRRCLLMWEAEPQRFPEDDVTMMWTHFCQVLGAYIRTFPVAADRVHRLIDELERHCPPSRPAVRYALDSYRMSVEARRGNLEEVERLWQAMRLREPPNEHLDPEGSAAVDAIMWMSFGRDDRAIAALAPVLTGQIPAERPALVASHLVMPYLRTGRTAEAVAAHHGAYAHPDLKSEEIASHLVFCALTGNEVRGLDVLHRNLARLSRLRSVGGLYLAAAAALLCRRITEKDLDEEWIWPCGPECVDDDHGVVWSYAELGADMHWQAVDLAERLDELNGTSFQSDAAMRLLRAEPIVEHLELPPGNGLPAHRAKPQVSPHRAATTAAELREELDRVRKMDHGRERMIALHHLQHNAFATDRQDVLADLRFAQLDGLLSAGPTHWSRPALFSTFTALVRRHDADPSLFDAADLDRLWEAAPVVLDRVLARATVHTAQIRGLMRILERHHRPGTRDLHHLRWYEVELEARCGDVDAARSAWARFESLPPCDAYTTWPDVLRRTRWWLDLGLDTEAIAAMTPVLAGDIPAEEDREDYLLLPYLRTGRADRAREVHERTFATAARAPEVAAHLEYCARTGGLDRAKQIIQRNLGLYHVSWDDLEFTFDYLRAHAAMVLACRSIVAAGRDEDWTWPADECCAPKEGWSYSRMATSTREALDLFGGRWVELTGSAFHSRRHAAVADDDVAAAANSG